MDARLVAALRKAACPGPEPQCRSDPIELSNACRAFYQSRLESARALKERWGPSGSRASGQAGETTSGSGDGGGGSGGGGGGDHTSSDKNENCRKKSSIDVAMETLRQEMTSLMEQDLSLMKQLLTLNEEIEELKWRRRYCWSRASIMTSSGDVDLGSLASFTSSDASLGWWRESGDLPPKYPGISSLSLHADHNRLSVYDEEDPTGTFNRHAVRRQGSLRALPSHAHSQGHLHPHPHPHHKPQHPRHHPEPLRHHDTHHNLHHESLHHQDSHHHQDSQRVQTDTLHRQQQQQQQRVAVSAGEKDSDFAERESFDSGIHEGYTDTSQTLQHTNSATEMTHL